MEVVCGVPVNLNVYKMKKRDNILFLVMLLSFFITGITKSAIVFYIFSFLIAIRGALFIRNGAAHILQSRNNNSASGTVKVDVLMIITGILLFVCLLVIFLLRKEILTQTFS